MKQKLFETIENLANSSIINDRQCAVELFNTKTTLTPRLGSCDDCKWVSHDLKSCNNVNVLQCNIFTNSEFKPK